jgi:predicted  nucleic acid-binding Zn ribbon protein
MWASDLRGKELPASRPCPLCGRQWKLRRDFATRFRHKCGKCRVVSL